VYLQHFQFSSEPFSIAPDPRFLFLSVRHEEALAHLLYGLREGGGFVALTGEVGTGKTTLCHCLMEQLPDNVDLALVFNPKLSSLELIATICDELGIVYPDGTSSIKVVTDALNRYLLKAHAKGRRTVVLIDEAQNLSLDVLEQIRLLTNLETKQTKLLQIILVGQPELNNLLNCKQLRQLSQRITGRYHLLPLDFNETRDYIHHRLAKVDGSATVFSAGAIRSLFRHSHGIPRLINTIADRALLGAFSKNKHQVSAGLVNSAADEILNTGKQFPWRSALAGLVSGVVLVTLGWLLWNVGRSEQAAMQQQPVNVQNQTSAHVKKPLIPVSTEPSAVKTALTQTLKDNIQQQTLTLPAAFRNLFKLFGLNAPENQSINPCELARQQGYACLIGNGNWRQILQFDRPVILELETGDGQKQPIVLSKAINNQVELDLGHGQTLISDLNQLMPLWNGNYVQLWKIPGKGKYILRKGDQGDNVVRLRNLLAQIENKPLDSKTPMSFDQELSDLVTHFQTNSGLEADGVVGPKTWILLNNSVNPDRPRLIMQR